MRKSKTLVKRISVLLSAFVFFIGVFFCAGERVEASNDVIDTNVFYKHGVFYSEGLGYYFSPSSGSSNISINIPFDSAMYNFHYFYYNSALTSTEEPGLVSFDFTVPIAFYLDASSLESSEYSNDITYVDGRFYVQFYASLSSSYLSSSTLYLDSVELVDPFGTTYDGFIYNPQCGSSVQTSVVCNLRESKIKNSTANDNFYLYLHFKGSGNTNDALVENFQLAIQNFNPLDFDAYSDYQRFTPTLYVGDPSNDPLYGYDSSAGSSASNALGDGIAEYEQAEGSLFDSASASIGDFSFVSLDSVPAVVTSISFVSSIMSMIFDESGGITGAGIVMSVSLCALIGAIVTGIYRYWHKDG